MRLFAFVIAVVCSCSAWGQSVTFSHEAAPASAVFKELSKQLGSEVKIGDPISRDTLLLKVHDVPKAQLLQKLAEVLHGEWVQKPWGQLLQRDDRLRDILVKKEVAARAEAFEKDLKAKTDTMVQRPFNKQTAEQITDFLKQRGSKTGEVPSRKLVREVIPAQRLNAKLIRLIGADKIAKVRPHRSLYFSNQPSRRYLPLPEGAGELIRQFEAEQALMESAFAAAGLALDDDHKVDTRYTLELRAISQNVVSVLTYCGPGRTNYLGNLNLQVQPMTGVDASLIPANFEPSLSAVSKELVETYRLNEYAGHVPSAGAIELIEHPEKHEPLSCIVGETFSSLADERQLQLVAVLPDECTDGIDQLTRGPKLDARVLLKQWSLYCDVKHDAKWLTVAPRWPVSELDNKPDRTAMGALFQRFFDARRNSLVAQSEYVHSMQYPQSTGAECLYSLFLNRCFPQFIDLSDYVSREFLWVYGSLSPEQRQRIEGEGLVFGTLEEAQKSLLAQAYERVVATLPDSFTNEAAELSDGAVLHCTRDPASVVAGISGGHIREFSVTEIAVQLLLQKYGVHPEKRDTLKQERWTYNAGQNVVFWMGKPGGHRIGLCSLAEMGGPSEAVERIDRLPKLFLEELDKEMERLSKKTPEELYKEMYGQQG